MNNLKKIKISLAIMILIGISFFYLVHLISAYSNNSFTNGLTNENLTFTPDLSFVQYIENKSSYSGIYLVNPTYAYDEDFSTYATTGGSGWLYQYVFAEYNLSQQMKNSIQIEKLNASLKFASSCFSPVGIIVSYYNTTSDSYIDLGTANAGVDIIANTSYIIPKDAYNSTINYLRMRFDISGQCVNGRPKLYETWINWDYYNSTRYLSIPQNTLLTNGYLNLSNMNQSSNLTNPKLNIGSLNVWNISGSFGTQNNKTSNLASSINSYLGICSYVGGFCQVPFIFHSDTVGILQYLNLIFNNEGFLENSQTYNSQTLTTNNEQFKINITYDSNYYTSSSAVLVYNGVSYSSSASTSGQNTIFTTNLNTPSTNGTYGFYWNVSLTNSSGINYFKSNNYTQLVNPINFGICSSTLNVSFINFTIKDITTKNNLNATFKSTWYIGNSTYQNYSYQDLSEGNSSFAFCFSPSDSSYTVSATIEYDNSNYAKNFYYLTNSVLTNNTNNITLYLLNDSLATLTTLNVVDRARKAIQDVYITVQYYDIGTDTFYTVAMAKSGYDGKDITYLNWYDSLYRFTLVKNGAVILATNSSKISSTPQEFLILDTSDFIYDKFNSMIYSLTYDNSTKNFVLTFTDPTGLVSAGCLKVVRQTSTNSTIICNQCQYTSSATLYCNIGAYGNGTFIASFYALGSYDTIYSILESIGVSFQSTIYNALGNLDASIYAFLFAGIVMVFFLITPVLGVIGALLGIFGAVALGFSNIDTAIFIGITIIGGVIIWLLKR